MFERPQGGDRALLVALDFGDADPAERMAELDALAVSAGATVVGAVDRPAPAARRRDSSPARARSRRSRARRAESGADLVIFNHALTGAQQRNLEQRARMPRRRPHEPDPRHLRAARAQRRRQAAGRARAGQAPAHAAGRRLDPPRAPEGRHRPARPRREAARDRPPAARRARQGAEGAARARRAPARDAGPHAAPRGRAHRGARRLHQRRQVDAVQPADRRQAPTPPTSCSRRSTRRCAGSTCPAPRRSCCPTPSASSATCRTISSPRSARRSRRPREADLLLHVVDAAHPNRDEQIAAVDAVLRGDRRRPRAADPRAATRSTPRASPPGVERDESGIISRRSRERADGRRLRRIARRAGRAVSGRRRRFPTRAPRPSSNA